MEPKAKQLSVGEEELQATIRRLRPVSDEERRYPRRENQGIPPTRYGTWAVQQPRRAQTEPQRSSAVPVRSEEQGAPLVSTPTGRPLSSTVGPYMGLHWTNPFLEDLEATMPPPSPFHWQATPATSDQNWRREPPPVPPRKTPVATARREENYFWNQFNSNQESRPPPEYRRPPSPPPTTRNQNPTGSSNPFQDDALMRLLEEQHRQQKVLLSRQGERSKLPRFDGNPLDWPLFIDHYRRSTEECDFTHTENMDRLEKALVDNAYKHVRPLFYCRYNPEAVIKELETTFGRPEIIIQELMQKAKSTPPPRDNKLQTILEFSTAIKHLVLTIKSLSMPIYLQNPQLLQELVEKLPDPMKLQWGMMTLMIHGKTPDLEDFGKFLEGLAKAANQVTLPSVTRDQNRKRDDGRGKTSRNYSLTTVREPPKVPARPTRKCEECSSTDHSLQNCQKFKEKPVDQRWELIKTKKLCFKCLKPGHPKDSCRSRMGCNVEGCTYRHHPLLHGSSLPPKTTEEPSTHQPSETKAVKKFTGNISYANGDKALLRIIPVELFGNKGSTIVNAIFDEGSQVTLLDSKVAADIGVKGELDPLRLVWTDGQAQEDNTSMKVSLEIGSVDGGKRYQIADVRTVEALQLPVQTILYEDIVPHYSHLKGTSFHYLPDEPPKILIGSRHIHLSLPREIKEGKEDEPLATRTRLGWVLHGPQGGSSGSSFLTLVLLQESDEDIIHKLVKESFELEAIGVKNNATPRSKDDQAAEEIMKKVTKRIGNRFETGLLWREGPFATNAKKKVEKLPPSYDVALKRHQSLERKFKRDPPLKEEFAAKIQHYLDKGYATKLTEEEIAEPSPVEWYLPVFATTHPNKPGKIRIVWDAASKSRGKSLNDFLFTGPDLLSNLPGLLIRFREKRIAFSGDITEMFHQILITSNQRPAQRFLWRDQESDEPSIYQLNVMMFGSVCSPYCAQFIRNLNASDFAHEYPEAAKAIQEAHYMDDYVDCRDTVEEALKIIRDVTHVHKGGGFQIAKWISNSPELLANIPPEDRSSAAKDLSEWSDIKTERALGLHWNPAEDVFTFRVNLERAGAGIATGEVIPTKRDLLRLVMLIWDPLGFLSHFTVKARMILQHLWRRNIGWDEGIPGDLFPLWNKFRKQLEKIADLKIPRCYAFSHESIQLHIFADASETGYCAVSYLRLVTRDKIQISLVLGKARVAPLKPKSVPRLELQAALCAARMKKFIEENLNLPISSTHLWSDSTTALRWIRSDARRFQQFVANRIGEIHEISEVGQWRWIPTKLNVADEGTREGSCNLSSDSRWFKGPEFLLENEDNWPLDISLDLTSEQGLEELKKELVLVALEPPPYPAYLPDPERFSKFKKLVRATAVVLLAIQKFKGVNRPEFQSLVEKAELMLIRQTQWESFPEEMTALKVGSTVAKKSRLFTLSPVLDKNGALRMKSRLTHSDEELLRMPIILPQKSRITKLLILDYHETLHH